MNLAEQALVELYPRKDESRRISVSYSAKFRKLNANVKYTPFAIHFNLSRDWLEHSEDLRKGLIQSLFIKMHKDKDYEKTLELDLYHKFMDNVGKYAKVEKTDEVLEQSFDRVNRKYFSGDMEKPNLVWGGEAFRKLGHYEYASNTILLSAILGKDENLLDYVMYHELLHKKHGNKRTLTGRMIHHSRAFREDEKRYEDKDAERKLSEFVRKQKRRRWIRWF